MSHIGLWNLRWTRGSPLSKADFQRSVIVTSRNCQQVQNVCIAAQFFNLCKGITPSRVCKRRWLNRAPCIAIVDQARLEQPYRLNGHTVKGGRGPVPSVVSNRRMGHLVSTCWTQAPHLSRALALSARYWSQAGFSRFQQKCINIVHAHKLLKEYWSRGHQQ